MKTPSSAAAENASKATSSSSSSSVTASAGTTVTINLRREKELTLKSPVGARSKVYPWPLKKGKGSVKKGEDKHDEAAEIVETIR